MAIMHIIDLYRLAFLYSHSAIVFECVCVCVCAWLRIAALSFCLVVIKMTVIHGYCVDIKMSDNLFKIQLANLSRQHAQQIHTTRRASN